MMSDADAKIEPDRMPQPAKVEAMAGYGLSAAEIARVLEVDLYVLEATCAHEIAAGAIKANTRVAENLYRKAIGDGRESVTAAIFWLKTRARWKETVVNEVTHDVADPLSAFFQEIAKNGRRIHDKD